MNNLLITSAGRRVSLVKTFKKELALQKSQAKVFVSDAFPLLSPAAHIADEYFQTLLLTNSEYIDDLLQICIANNVTIIIPTLDIELILLAENKSRFLKHDIEIVISDLDFISATENKLTSNEIFKNLNLETPLVYSKDNFKLPIFIKPLVGSSSKSNYIVKNKSELQDCFFENDNLFFSEYLDHNSFDEYTCDLYYDKNSSLKCVVPRKRIEVRGGEVSKGLTKKNIIKDFLEINMAKIEGARGCITIQIFMHKKTKKLVGIEINPRFGGGYPLSYLAGANFPKWIIEEYMYNKIIAYFDAWEDNLLMLRYDDEIIVRNYED